MTSPAFFIAASALFFTVNVFIDLTGRRDLPALMHAAACAAMATVGWLNTWHLSSLHP